MWRYRVLISLLASVVLLRHGRGRLVAPSASTQDHIWVHGASNGELASVRPLLEKLIARRPDLHWLVTANTETGRDMVRGWTLPKVDAHLAPVDLSWLTRKTLRARNVTAHVTLEAELWPHRVLSCPGPVILLGARMSDGTARGWARLGGLAGRALSRVAFASAQDQGSAQRLLDLGLSDRALGPVVDLKAFYDAQPIKIPSGIHRAKTWLAASTHEGEEQTVIAAHIAARKAEPGLRLILAPRHPRRAAEVRAMIEAAGLEVGQRSAGDSPDRGEVYLADTMGEMPLWYAACGRVFVGGTLTDRGGHTPYEPAAYGASLIHGPDVRNFRAAYARLEQADAALCIADAASLAGALSALADETRQVQAGRTAQAVLRPDTNLDAVCDAVLRVLDKG
ncbi:3-deoxy-D-manno-octulosonic acid transferase [Sagittula sp. S175]|uniref:3-deoxy-D-manno-octulosonic acid transferase n=1 Tax=Sagittula sp. S175 TaxID=3415129 RepID=UPI003C7E450D